MSGMPTGRRPRRRSAATASRCATPTSTSPTRAGWLAIVADIEAREGGLDVLVNNAGHHPRDAALRTSQLEPSGTCVQRVNATSVVLGHPGRGAGDDPSRRRLDRQRRVHGRPPRRRRLRRVLGIQGGRARDDAGSGAGARSQRHPGQRISPGGVETPMNDDEPPGGTSAAAPLGRRAQPEEISPLVVYLASTGVVLRHRRRLPDRRRGDASDDRAPASRSSRVPEAAWAARTAEVFLERGWTVLALDIAPMDLMSSGRLVPIIADVRDRAAARRRAARARSRPRAAPSTRSRTSPGSTRLPRSRP